MDYFRNLINHICGVWIVARDEVLIIEDRRPTLRTALSFGALLIVLAFAVWSWLTGTLKLDGINIFFFAFVVIVALIFAFKDNFREVYVFNKKTDTYTFTRQSILRKDVLEGSASQFRAVQIERRRTEGNNDQIDTEKYMVALLMQGMLLGQSDTQILRETPPFLNSLEAERRIAAAISKFLNIPRQGGVVDVL